MCRDVCCRVVGMVAWRSPPAAATDRAVDHLDHATERMFVLGAVLDRGCDRVMVGVDWAVRCSAPAAYGATRAMERCCRSVVMSAVGCVSHRGMCPLWHIPAP